MNLNVFDFQNFRYRSIDLELEDVKNRVAQLRQQRQELLREVKSCHISWQTMKSENVMDKYSKAYEEYGMNRHITLIEKQIKMLKKNKQKHNKNIEALRAQFNKNKIKIQQLKTTLLKKAQSIKDTIY